MLIKKNAYAIRLLFEIKSTQMIKAINEFNKEHNTNIYRFVVEKLKYIDRQIHNQINMLRLNEIEVSEMKRNITLLIRFNKIFLTHLYCELCVAYQEEYLCEYDDDNLPSFDDDKLKLIHDFKRKVIDHIECLERRNTEKLIKRIHEEIDEDVDLDNDKESDESDCEESYQEFSIIPLSDLAEYDLDEEVLKKCIYVPFHKCLFVPK